MTPEKEGKKGEKNWSLCTLGLNVLNIFFKLEGFPSVLWFHTNWYTIFAATGALLTFDPS